MEPDVFSSGKVRAPHREGLEGPTRGSVGKTEGGRAGRTSDGVTRVCDRQPDSVGPQPGWAPGPASPPCAWRCHGPRSQDGRMSSRVPLGDRTRTDWHSARIRWLSSFLETLKCT